MHPLETNSVKQTVTCLLLHDAPLHDCTPIDRKVSAGRAGADLAPLATGVLRPMCQSNRDAAPD